MFRSVLPCRTRQSEIRKKRENVLYQPAAEPEQLYDYKNIDAIKTAMRTNKSNIFCMDVLWYDTRKAKGFTFDIFFKSNFSD